MTSSPELHPHHPLAAGVSSLSVVFSDADRQTDVGSVFIHPYLSFKSFQSDVAHLIGVAPHQISTSLVRRRKARPSPDVRRRVPIDESTDFAAVSKERDCFVLAVLRRSSRARRPKKSASAAAPAPEMVILRRNPADTGGDRSIAAGLGLRLWEHGGQLIDLQRQRGLCLMSTATGPYRPYAGAPPPSPAAAESVVCEECESAAEERRSPGFHWCVYDAVTVAFRSTVGPIERPSKKLVTAGPG